MLGTPLRWQSDTCIQCPGSLTNKVTTIAAGQDIAGTTVCARIHSLEYQANASDTLQITTDGPPNTTTTADHLNVDKEPGEAADDSDKSGEETGACTCRQCEETPIKTYCARLTRAYWQGVKEYTTSNTTEAYEINQTTEQEKSDACITITGTSSSDRVVDSADEARDNTHNKTIMHVKDSALIGKVTECDHGTLTANKCTIAILTLPAGVSLRKMLDDPAKTVYVSDKVVKKAGADSTGGHLVSALKLTIFVEESSTCLSLKVSSEIDTARLLANAGLIKIGADTNLAESSGYTTKDTVYVIVDNDLHGRAKPAVPRNVFDDNLPTVGGPYGAIEGDVATNAGALGFGAALCVSDEVKGKDPEPSREITKCIVPKTMCAGQSAVQEVLCCSGTLPGTTDSLSVLILVAGDLAGEASEKTGSEQAGVLGIIVVSVTSNDQAKKGGTTVLLHAGGSLGVPTLALEDKNTTDVVINGRSKTEKSEVTIRARLAGSDTTVTLGDIIVLITLGTTVDEVVTGTANQKIMVACATLAEGKGAGETVNPGGSTGHVLTTLANQISREVPAI